MKKILSMLLTIVMLCGLLLPSGVVYAAEPVESWEVEEIMYSDWLIDSIKRAGDWEYTVKEDGVALIRCYSKKETVKIPRKIKGKKVVAILADDWGLMHDHGFFKSKKVKHVILSSAIKRIAGDAWMCDQLESITIGKSLKTIRFETNEMSYCENGFPETLKKIIVDPNNKWFSSENGVLYNKDKTTLIRYPSAKAADTFELPNTVRTITAHAFDGAKHLETVKLGNAIKEISNCTFVNCEKLENVQIGESLEYLGYDAFEGTPFYKNLFNNATNNAPVYWKSILMGAKGTLPKTVIVKDGTKGIVYSAFKNQKELENLVLPESLQSIDTWAFKGCKNLKTISMHQNIRIIGVNAFTGTAFWKQQPKGLVYYGDLLLGCKGKAPEKVTIKDGTRIIPDNFLFDEQTTEVVLPDSVEHIGSGAFSWCNRLNGLTIPKSVTSIGEDAFAYTPIDLTVTKDSYAHKHLKKNGFKKIVVKK